MLPSIGLRSRNRGKSHVNNYTNRIYGSLFFFFFTFNEYFLFTRIPMGMVIPGGGSCTATFK